ncbi:hypothetical protein AAHA92_14904 [Salvia divinorum]|uniref:Protein FAR1-RELATED SEQUENCE n=1 Tax=Salvia divinorum TaxID=28513 RepID=A0ABD1HD67_SALDI
MDETISEDIIPKIGMEFETEAEAYDVYMKYAKATGFGTRKMTAHKDPITDNILDISFCCCREGFRTINNRGVTVKNPHPEIRCFRQMSNVQQTQIDMAQSCGLPPKKIIDVMVKEVGGIQHLGFTHIDLKNYLRTKRTLEIKQDAMMGKRPKTISTDQDQAMSAALASKWSSTYHRLCVWHIFQNAAIHLFSVFSSFKNTFAADFSRCVCVYDFEEESEFLDAWNEIEELRKTFESKIESETQLGSSRIYKARPLHRANEHIVTYDSIEGKTNNVTVETNKVGNISTDGDVNESQIKGVKPKGRVTYQTSKRPKNALEQAINRKRKLKATKSGLEHVSSTQESGGTSLINDEYWNLTYTAFDHPSTS